MVPAVLRPWRYERSGLEVSLFARDGSNGQIRIRMRRAPLAPSPQILATTLDELDVQANDVAPAVFEGFTTVEGEYGTLTHRRGLRVGHRVDVTLAILFGDDWYVTIAGVAAHEHAAAMQATVRELASCYSLGLGELRRRRYRYAAPAGWSARARGLVEEWYRPGTTRAIVVFPARPLVETRAGAVDRALHELVDDGFVATADDQRPLVLPRFASGLARSVVGVRGEERVHHDVAVLQDGRFLYVCRMESTPEALAADRAVFVQLVSSIEPLPVPQHGDTPGIAPALAASWAD